MKGIPKELEEYIAGLTEEELHGVVLMVLRTPEQEPDAEPQMDVEYRFFGCAFHTAEACISTGLLMRQLNARQAAEEAEELPEPTHIPFNPKPH